MTKMVYEEQEIPALKIAIQRAEASVERYAAALTTTTTTTTSSACDDDDDMDGVAFMRSLNGSSSSSSSSSKGDAAASNLATACPTDEACGCPHLWECLPHELSLEFCRTNTSLLPPPPSVLAMATMDSTSTTTGASRIPAPTSSSTAGGGGRLRLRHPVHALHLQSQLGPDFCLDEDYYYYPPCPTSNNHLPNHNYGHPYNSATPNNNPPYGASSPAALAASSSSFSSTTLFDDEERYYLQHGLVYGEEQERAIVLQTEGLVEYWHPLVRSPVGYQPPPVPVPPPTKTTSSATATATATTSSTSSSGPTTATRPTTTSTSGSKDAHPKPLPSPSSSTISMLKPAQHPGGAPPNTEIVKPAGTTTVSTTTTSTTDKNTTITTTTTTNNSNNPTSKDDDKNKGGSAPQPMEGVTTTDAKATTPATTTTTTSEGTRNSSTTMEKGEKSNSNASSATDEKPSTSSTITKETPSLAANAATPITAAEPPPTSTPMNVDPKPKDEIVESLSLEQKEENEKDAALPPPNESKSLETTTASTPTDRKGNEKDFKGSNTDGDVTAASTTATTTASTTAETTTQVANVSTTVTDPKIEEKKNAEGDGNENSSGTAADKKAQENADATPQKESDGTTSNTAESTTKPAAAETTTSEKSESGTNNNDDSKSAKLMTEQSESKPTNLSVPLPKDASAETKSAPATGPGGTKPPSPNTKGAGSLSPSAMKAEIADPKMLITSSTVRSQQQGTANKPLQSAGKPLEPPKREYLLSDSEYSHYYAQEEQIRRLRTSVLSKRSHPTTNKKGKANSSANHAKKRKAEHRFSHLIHPNPIGQMTRLEEENYLGVMKKATKQVEHWMEHFRLARRSFWRGQRNESLTSQRRHFVFGAFGALDQMPSRMNGPRCQKCFSDSGNEKVLHCLECPFVGCLHAKGDSGANHMLEHMALSGHHLGVTLEASPQIYCFDCNKFVRHEIFEQEMLRLDLEEQLPWLAWKDQPVARSFDAMRFVHIADVGVLWNGMVAAYPATVPTYHLDASLSCHQRLFSFHGNIAFLKHPITDSINEFAKKQASLESSQRFRITKPVGMYNLGDTCFQSAVFQCILNCSPMQDYFMKVGHNHLACPLYPKEKPTKKANKAKQLPQVCIACELDKMLLRYYGSTIGFRAMDALAMTRARERVTDMTSLNFYQPRGEAITASDMLAATWKCADLSHLAGYGQNDAHEFLHGFLDVLQKHIKKYRHSVSDTIKGAAKDKLKRPMDIDSSKLDDSGDIIKSLFEGKLRSVLLCTACGEKRKQSESFLSISLPLSKEVHRATESRPGESTDGQGRLAKSKLSIERQLRHFTLPESLSDPVDCPACGKKTPTTKQHVVSRLPKILCLHLKRFDDKKKINDFVSFPLEGLNMGSLLPQFCEVTRFDENTAACNKNDGPIVEAELLYDLFGTVNHFGTLQSGHYVANVRVENNWYHCNDAHVSYISEEDVLKSDAYLLFYTRR